MSNDDERKVPPPLFPRKPSLRELGAPVRPPFMDDGDDEEEDVKDEATWVASGSPYLPRERTSETSFYEDEVEKPTNIDWNQPSSPLGTDDGMTFDARPPTSPLSEGAPTDYPTEPGFGADGSLSALRDAMRSGARPRMRASALAPAPMPASRNGPMAPPSYSGGPPHSEPSAPLPIPTPRARTSDPVRAIAPSRRGAQPMPARVRPGPTAAPVSAAPVRRSPNMAALVGPIVIGGIAVLFVATLALRVMVPDDPGVIEAPMLPVVGGPAPKAMPAPPFDVDAPAAFRPQLTGGQASDTVDLPVRVMEASAAGNAELAAAWSDQLVRVENRPERFFGHAALLASAGEVDAAYYWLVRAIQEHGVPPEWLVSQDAFRLLWIDSRWDSFVRWAILAKRHHAARGASPATLVLPQSMDDAVAKDDARRVAANPAAKAPTHRSGTLPSLPVVVWLDDVGGNGSSVLNWGQALADDLGVLVVGLGGPERIGPAGSWWTSDPETDRKHIDSALSAIPGATPDPARRYLVGVGQGAQFAVELVLRDATYAAGALALGPTDDWKGARDKSGEGNRDRKQDVRLVAGALDPESHTLLRLDRGRLMRAGAEVTMTIEDKPWPDGMPPDLGDRVRAWILGRIDPAAAAIAEAALAQPVDVAAAGTAAE